MKAYLPMVLLRDMHSAFEVKRPSALDVNDILELRVKLLSEETIEVIDAVGELQTAKSPEALIAAKAHLLKELADVLYVTYGFAELFDLPLQEAFNEVHANNMTKLGPDGKVIRRADGKVLKPAGFVPCDLRHLIQGRV